MIYKGTLEGTVVKLDTKSIDKEILGYPAVAIVGGEFAIIPKKDNISITTLLGSCVSIMLTDNQNFISMNHYLLPGNTYDDNYRFGCNAASKMLDELVKLGANRSKIVAKIAGGANVLSSKVFGVGNQNVEFAKNFCEEQEIEIISESVLANHGRVVLLTPSFETFVRKVSTKMMTEYV